MQEGSPVPLHTGNSFDPDGDALTYRWMQIAGTAVSLSDPAAMEPSFAAPLVGSSAETLVFALIVSDGADESRGEILVFRLVVRDASSSSEPDA